MMTLSTDLGDRITRAIGSVIGPAAAALHEPTFDGNELRYVKECIDSTFVSSVGKFVDRFEHDLTEFTGSSYAVAVVNGTAALHISLKLAGVSERDEVLLPALTFIATANAVAYCGATPHFVDNEIQTLGIDAIKLREYLASTTEQTNGMCVNRHTGRVIRAIVPMHTFGHPVDIDALFGISQDFNIVLIEDAAESLGSYYKNKHTGTFGLMGTLSFNGNKTITTGGGGAILTNNLELARRAKHITTTSKIKHQWAFRHDEIGYNYRMPNINAALGCAQLEQLPDFIKAKRTLFEKYAEAFANISQAQLVREPVNCSSNYWLQSVLLKTEFASERDHVLEVTNAAGYMTRPVWDLMNTLAPYIHCPKMDLTQAEDIASRLINIPSSQGLALRLQ
jgi:aminotransferase in exopolysaccharide biosynthesis